MTPASGSCSSSPSAASVVASVTLTRASRPQWSRTVRVKDLCVCVCVCVCIVGGYV